MFDAFYENLAKVLNFFFVLTRESYGGAIILLTLSVMIILTPLTLKGTRSMMRMQRLQPEMKRLQKEYKDDRQKLNEELMKFYKENSINPLGGCLPLLAQMPVFFVLFHVLRGLVGSLSTTDCPEGVPECFNPRYLAPTSQMYQALNHTNEMNWLGVNLAQSASSALADSFVVAIPYLFMIVLVLVSSFVQQKQVSGRNPGAEVNQQQQMLLKLMPAFMGLISFTLQGALVLYFVVSNFWRVGQQWFIGRHIYGKDEDGKPIEASAREVDKPSAKPDGDSPRGFRALLAGQADNARSARADAKNAKASSGPSSKPKQKPKPGTKPGTKPGASSTNGRSNGRVTPKAASIPQPRPRKKKRK